MQYQEEDDRMQVRDCLALVSYVLSLIIYCIKWYGLTALMFLFFGIAGNMGWHSINVGQTLASYNNGYIA
jgi:hypothetical protein